MKDDIYTEVVVVGAGHAGCEAATASARAGANTILVTYSVHNIAEMSCNPSIGGVGKGIIVREIDALDGVMGKAIDSAGIHFKMLNTSKGPAVWGPRAQADRTLYKFAMRDILCNHPIYSKKLSLLYDEVIDILVENAYCYSIRSDDAPIYKVIGVVLASGRRVLANSVIITTGTFLKGEIHIGNKNFSAGRYNEAASNILGDKIRSLKLKMGRLKTGTPPRIAIDSINFNALERQPSDKYPIPFSYLNEKIHQKQIDCYITHTNEFTHKIILDNITLSPMYSGRIISTGPRYCPSIEDKVTRFADKLRHQIFLEPEGLESNLVYPNGISTSLPEEIQEKLIHSIHGLENAKIVRYGYAIEYDYINPKQLKNTLELKTIHNLYLAGQINGTTGYEEAAGQGIIAGINAGLSIKKSNQTFTLNRSEAYIGVMIEDLIQNGVSEPYRMMTSRAEYRIFLRYDNADIRLTTKAAPYGFISKERLDKLDQVVTSMENMRKTLQSCTVSYGQMQKRKNQQNQQNQQNQKETNLIINTEYCIDKHGINTNSMDKHCVEINISNINKEIYQDQNSNEFRNLTLNNCKELLQKISNNQQIHPNLNLEDMQNLGNIQNAHNVDNADNQCNMQKKFEFPNILKDGEVKSMYTILSLHNIDLAMFLKIFDDFKSNTKLKINDMYLLHRLKIESMYYNYNKKYAQEMRILQTEAAIVIPHNLNYNNITGLSNEMRLKLSSSKPNTMNDIKNIEGITPIAIITIHLYLKKHYGE